MMSDKIGTTDFEVTRKVFLSPVFSRALGAISEYLSLFYIVWLIYICLSYLRPLGQFSMIFCPCD